MFVDEFEERNSKQQSIINDQQKMIQVLKDEQNKAKVHFEKQCATLNEQCLREKNDVKTVGSSFALICIHFVPSLRLAI